MTNKVKSAIVAILIAFPAALFAANPVAAAPRSPQPMTAVKPVQSPAAVQPIQPKHKKKKKKHHHCRHHHRHHHRHHRHKKHHHGTTQPAPVSSGSLTR